LKNAGHRTQIKISSSPNPNPVEDDILYAFYHLDMQLCMGLIHDPSKSMKLAHWKVKRRQTHADTIYGFVRSGNEGKEASECLTACETLFS
jgi:hypothetical protein